MDKNLAIRFILAEGILFILLSFPVSLPGQLTQTHSIQKISIEWNKGRPSGTINILNGSLTKIEIIKGPGKIIDNRFEFSSSGNARITLEITGVQNNPGPEPTIISVKTNTNFFLFF
jgi:hypothetical protein